MNRTRTLLTATAAALALAACSSGTETASSAPTVTTAPTTSAPSAAASPTSSAAVSSAPAADGQTTPIVMTVNGQRFTADINDSQVSQDFLATLPRTLSWFRQGSIEFITELDAPLTETGPFYTDVQPGDIVYYNPADSFTIIYEETSSVPTLTKMGEITSNLAAFRDLPDNIDIRIERG